MADWEHIRVVRKGAEAVKAWHKEFPDKNLCLNEANLFEADLRNIDLSGAMLFRAYLKDACLNGTDLGGAHLNKANLCGADMAGAFLSNAELIGACLVETDLREANLSGAWLSQADLRDADLRKANLQKVDLSGSDLRKARLKGIDLAGALCQGTNFSDLDLSEARGLDEIVHRGPSVVGIDTLLKSKGKIPKAFLKGCGVPEPLIDYLPSLIGSMQPFEFRSISISHSPDAADFCELLHSRLNEEGLRVWLDPHSTKSGQEKFARIERAVPIYDRLLLVLSESSMQSNWIKAEISHARKLEKSQNRQVLFPISLVDSERLENWKCVDIGKDPAEEIRQCNIPAFNDWRERQSFEREFLKLAEDLKKSD